MDSTRVHVSAAGVAYDVVIGPGVLDHAADAIAEATESRRIALICDDRVADLFGMRLTTDLARAGFEVFPFTFPAGERSKTWTMAGELLEALASTGLGRDDAVVAVGGGVTGDLAGFVAASYLRGVDFIQIPTTLLAQVDSSVGGKTGVDLTAGKNLAGAFKPPMLVLADTGVLDSLPEEEWRSGLAEVAKSAVLDSEDFTVWLESQADSLMSRDPDTVVEAVRRCVVFKAGVVSSDERESGPRECLNYGHTAGHAIETVAGYGTFTHGACVAEGMRIAVRIAAQVAEAPADFIRRQDRLLDSLGLPFLETDVAVGDVLEVMRSDKKARRGSIRFVLASAPGQWECAAVDDDVIAEHLVLWASRRDGA